MFIFFTQKLKIKTDEGLNFTTLSMHVHSLYVHTRKHTGGEGEFNRA